MRMILVLVVICMLPILVPIPSATASPARAARTAFKGYELYSYEGSGTWHYVLLSGTNRIKSINEVASAPALTLPQLKERLGAMAVGETVSWSHARIGTYKGALSLSRPDASVVRDLQALAQKLQIHLVVP